MHTERIRNAQVNVCQDIQRYAKFFQVSRNKKPRLSWANAVIVSGGGAENRTPNHSRLTCGNAKPYGKNQENILSKCTRRLSTSGL